jgi:flagellin
VGSLRTNVSSLNAQRLVEMVNVDVARTAERLASGLRINNAQDDPSGVGMVAHLDVEIRGAAAASLNLQHATSALQVADEGLMQVTDVLQRMRELSVQANNTGLSSSEVDALDAEYQALISSIDQIVATSAFNGNVLLDGTFPNGGSLEIQSGASQTQTATVDFGTDYRAAALNVSGTDLQDATNAAAAQTAVDAAIATVTSGLAQVGAKQTEIDAVKSNLDAASVATQQARMRIRDADVAAEVAELVRGQLLQQAGASALSSANMSPTFLVALLSK